MRLNNTFAALNNSMVNQKETNKSLNKLSSGLRINKASDDASGLAIADKLRTHASGIKQGIENGNSAVAMLNIADKAVDELSNIFDIIKSKAIQMATATTSEEGKKIIKSEIIKLIENHDNIVNQTNYNGIDLLRGYRNLTFQMGDRQQDTIVGNIKTVQSYNLGKDDPYKLVNFANGFKERASDFTPVSAIPSSVDIFSITTDPPSSPLTITHTPETKVSFFSSSDSTVLDGTDGFYDISNYYESKGFSTEWHGGVSTENKLTDYNLDSSLLFILQPSREFEAEEIQVMEDYLNKGGRIFFLGEHSGYSSTENLNISQTISKLGGDMSIKGGMINGDNTQTNTGPTKNLNNSPLLAGVDTFTTGTYASLEVDASLTEPIMVDDNNRIIMAEQKIGNGRITLFADQNPFDAVRLNDSSIQNNTFLDNLLIDSAQRVTEITGQPPRDDINLTQQARDLMSVIDASLNQLNSERSEIGSIINQIESSIRNNMNDYINTKNAESIIRDVDYAHESANFNKLNIIGQSGSFAQTQSNETQQRVLELLK